MKTVPIRFSIGKAVSHFQMLTQVAAIAMTEGTHHNQLS
jgi:hypothetical protein